MERVFFALGAGMAFLGVALGAFGAHGLRDARSPADLATWDTAARYQQIHALALVATAWASAQWPSWRVHAAGWLFVAGIVLFSGSLYALVLTAQRGLGAVAPLGGLSFLAGWTLLAWAALRG